MSCRTSPPQGGRSTRNWPFAPSRLLRRIDGSREKLGRNYYPISLLVGEMAGKPEGGRRHIKTEMAFTANDAIE
ncbi:hypothetical protein E6C51_00600 [Allorhizobium terrae]|uniref:Uncharacterized protein n=1 Tax=Allorhizobium terrae TaxID=1848972 RepID=A0A4S4A6P2_9HYPH|nr:hypothetical protein E6C51_00600 [Allorhizobium terrae]